MYDAADFVSIANDRRIIRAALLVMSRGPGPGAGPVTPDESRAALLAAHFAPVIYAAFAAAASRLGAIAEEDADTSTSAAEEFETLAAKALAFDAADRIEDMAARTGNGPDDDDDLACEECGNPMVVNRDGTSNHLIPDSAGVDAVDHDQDEDHAARAPEDDEDDEDDD